MTKYVKINEDAEMLGAELEHGRVYPVAYQESSGNDIIKDASGWPYPFHHTEVTEIDLADWEYKVLRQEGEYGVLEPEYTQAKIEKASAALAAQQDKFKPGDVVDWVDERGNKLANNQWGESVVVERKDLKYSEGQPEGYTVRNKHDGGIGLIRASELALHAEPKPDLRFHEYVEPEVDEIQKPGLWEALNLEPNPAQSKFFIMYNEPENPDAPTMKELGEAQDISGYVTDFDGFKLGEWQESQMLPDEDEAVHHPAHYGGDSVYEVIKVIEAWGLGFHLGNAVKYVARAGKKDPETEIEDLEKSRWYIDRRINSLKTAQEGEDA